MVFVEQRPLLIKHPENELRFSSQKLTLPIAQWVYERLSMAKENNNHVFMAMRLFDEINEIEEELEKPNFSVEAYGKEVVDALFFAISLAANIQPGYLESIHLPSLAHRLNGIGKRSDVLDRMRSVALDIPDSKDVRREIEMFLMYWFSYVRHNQLQKSPDKILEDVLEKNGTYDSGNYPAMYFSGTDWKTGELLNDEEARQQFFHSKSMMRILRVHFQHPSDGLKPFHHLKYAHLIFDFRSSEKNQELLRQQLGVQTASNWTLDHYLRQARLDPSHTSYENIKHRLRHVC
jgi:hypothetical protein